MDIKNNKVIQVNNTSSALKHPSSVPKPVTRPQIPVDVRRELATPINSEMHSVFSGSKPMDKGQKSPTVQPCTQSQDTLQHQQPSLDDSRSAQPAAMLSLPPFQQQSMEGPAAQKSSQAQGVISGSESAVAAEPQPIQLHLPGIYAHSGALLQASAEGVPSRPPRCLPAPDIAGTLPQRSTELPAQQSQLMSEHTVPAAPTVSTDQMQARSEPAGPPADAIIVQACSASMPAQNPTPTAELAASAAGSCPLQGQRQVSTGLPQADTDPATQQASKQALPKRALMHVPQAQPAEVLKTDLLKHMQVL